MKKRACILISLLILLCSFTPGFAASYTHALPENTPVFAGPGYDTSLNMILDANGVFTIVEEAWDEEGNLWGRLKSGAGWALLEEADAFICTPVSAYFADDYPLEGMQCHYLAIDRSGYACEVLLVANESLRQVDFCALHYDGDTMVEDPLYHFSSMSEDIPILASVAFHGDMSAYGLSFLDEAGELRLFSVSISGRDGSLVLSEIQ